MCFFVDLGIVKNPTDLVKVGTGKMPEKPGPPSKSLEKPEGKTPAG
jgi:hypothetical protein